MDGRVKVEVFGQVATFVVTRADGHTLSLSSMDRTLVHFDRNTAVKDYGFVVDAAKFASILADFITGKPVTQETVNGYDYKNQAWVRNGRYYDCSHSESNCGCYGRKHAGETISADAEIY